MFSPSMIIAQSKINELHAEAAANRLAKKDRSISRRARLSVALSNLRASFLPDPTLGLPKLTDYPYRS